MSPGGTWTMASVDPGVDEGRVLHHEDILLSVLI